MHKHMILLALVIVGPAVGAGCFPKLPDEVDAIGATDTSDTTAVGRSRAQRPGGCRHGPHLL